MKNLHYTWWSNTSDVNSSLTLVNDLKFHISLFF